VSGPAVECVQRTRQQIRHNLQAQPAPTTDPASALADRQRVVNVPRAPLLTDAPEATPGGEEVAPG
jgi:hypothetical protein